jgi:membrane-anchored protein YejM (alkaline phosphatase superfamily)
MAFNLEEWNKLSEAERERRYRRRLQGEEHGKNIAAFIAFILICALLIYVFTDLRGPTPDAEPVAPRNARSISGQADNQSQ